MSRHSELRPPLRAGEPPVEVVRSRRRRRGATAFERDGRIVVQLPAWLPEDQAERTIAALVGRVTGRVRARDRGGDAWLLERARRLGQRWFDGVAPSSATWSSRMSRRWASATPATGAIRVSDRAAGFPDRVLDYLLVHELAHLVEANHSAAFHALVQRYPHTDWAQGFLAGVRHAAGSGLGADPDDDPAGHLGGVDGDVEDGAGADRPGASGPVQG